MEVTWEHRTWGVSPVQGQHWTDHWGVRFIGDKATLNVTSLRYEFTPTDAGKPEAFHVLSPDGDPANANLANAANAYAIAEERHAVDFMTARDTRTRPVADIGEAHISSSCCVLANIAQELGRPVSYDPEARTIPGDAEATASLARAYRLPWVHPDPNNV